MLSRAEKTKNYLGSYKAQTRTPSHMCKRPSILRAMRDMSIISSLPSPNNTLYSRGDTWNDYYSKLNS